jgi:hypothetical protein
MIEWLIKALPFCRGYVVAIVTVELGVGVTT